MDKEQAINYLRSSGFSDEQIKAIEGAFTCGNAISREAVLDITWEEPSYTDAMNVLTEVRDKVKELPPVNPQKPKSEWEHDHEILKAYSDGASAVLDKVRAEIEHVKDNPLFGMVSNDTMLEVIIEIIDKYKAESGDKDADKKCTYKETGCGSCKWQLDCPIEADEAESEEKNEVSVSDKSNP